MLDAGPQPASRRSRGCRSCTRLEAGGKLTRCWSTPALRACARCGRFSRASRHCLGSRPRASPLAPKSPPPERLPRRHDPLRAVFNSAHPIERDDVFLKLCDGLKHLRDLVVHHALDRQNDLSPQREAALYRDLAKALIDTTKALGIAGNPRQIREQVHDHLVAAFEEVYGPDVDPASRGRHWEDALTRDPALQAREWEAALTRDADLRAREFEDALIRLASESRVFSTAASLIEREVAAGDLNWLPGKTLTYPPRLLKTIEYLWTCALRRKAGMSVNRKNVDNNKPRRSVAGGPFLRFVMAVLELLGLPGDPNNVRQAILRDREQRPKSDSATDPTCTVLNKKT